MPGRGQLTSPAQHRGTRRQGRQGSWGWGRSTARTPRGQAHTHTNGQEVPEGNQVPQAVKAAVAEEELGASQKRRPVLGPWRGLGRQHTCSETHVLAGEPSPPGLRKCSQTHTCLHTRRPSHAAL